MLTPLALCHKVLQYTKPPPSPCAYALLEQPLTAISHIVKLQVTRTLTTTLVIVLPLFIYADLFKSFM